MFLFLAATPPRVRQGVPQLRRQDNPGIAILICERQCPLSATSTGLSRKFSANSRFRFSTFGASWIAI
jgi:hypothetical protein